MIIIATNNGHLYLEKLLFDFENFFINKEICLIDTGSTDEESLKFLDKIKNKKIFSKLSIQTLETPYKGYDSGAYIYAMKNINSDKYYFIQDSISIKNKDFFDDIDKKLKDNTVVGIIYFDSNFYDNEEQVNFCSNKFGVKDFDLGIFGPMFAITKNDVNKIIQDLNYFPSNKNEQCAMERCWPALFKSKDIQVEFLDGNHNNRIFETNGYKYLNKQFANRI